MKKKIGISYTKTNFLNYWNWFTPGDLKNDTELVELNFEKNNSEDIYQCDGFVLTGGVDTHPSFYNGRKDLPLFSDEQITGPRNLSRNATDQCIGGR